MTLCWIYSTSFFLRMLSPMLNFSMQKLVLRALPMAVPPCSLIPQLKISSSIRVWCLWIKLAMALEPSSPMLEFLKYKYFRTWLLDNSVHKSLQHAPSNYTQHLKDFSHLPCNQLCLGFLSVYSTWKFSAKAWSSLDQCRFRTSLARWFCQYHSKQLRNAPNQDYRRKVTRRRSPWVCPGFSF